MDIFGRLAVTECGIKSNQNLKLPGKKSQRRPV